MVASPTPRDLRNVFAVLPALERAIAVELSEKFAGQTIAPLHEHLKNEASARASGASVLANAGERSCLRLMNEWGLVRPHQRRIATGGNEVFDGVTHGARPVFVMTNR